MAESTLKQMVEQEGPGKAFKSSRQPGAGRPSKSDEYGQLLGVMLNLFDGCGEGLRSHPRLITDVLYVEKTTWMNMPRAVSILRQAYGIDISLSCAYTYTQSCKQGTIQAKRHHKEVPVSLKRSTRDVVKDPSINIHFATADMQYSYCEAFNRSEETAVVGRDDKAKVHTDTEVVDRPSKSWRRIRYSDHGFEKDSRRSVTVTTYQFVVQKEITESCLITHLEGVPVSRTRVTGPGLCLVKSTYFEESTAFRHFNELLFVVSQERHRSHFVHKQNGTLKPNLLVTVDGGGDERPRNKLTKFLMTTIRLLLDLDRVKVQSFAEYDSKLHSVERLHSAEGRAISQAGDVPSRAVHRHETDEHGHHDDAKMKENMNHAAHEVVMRLDGTPFASRVIQAVRSPSPSSWVFPPEVEGCIREFLRNDSARHRLKSNFEMKPTGAIWENIKALYSVSDPGTISAGQVYREMTNPDITWNQHYGFAIYRSDENWRGSGRRRFEVQPMPDVGKLPEFHYVPFGAVNELADEHPLADWITKEDFYLPSANIHNAIATGQLNDNSDPAGFEESARALSYLVGVSVTEIKQYLEEKRRKTTDAESNATIVRSFSSSPLSLLKKAELITVIKHFHVKVIRQCRKGELLMTVDNLLRDRNADPLLLIRKLFPQVNLTKFTDDDCDGIGQ